MPEKLRELLILAGITGPALDEIEDISYFIEAYVRAKVDYDKPNMPFARIQSALAMNLSLPEVNALRPHLKRLRECQQKRLESLNEQACPSNSEKS